VDASTGRLTRQRSLQPAVPSGSFGMPKLSITRHPNGLVLPVRTVTLHGLQAHSGTSIWQATAWDKTHVRTRLPRPPSTGRCAKPIITELGGPSLMFPPMPTDPAISSLPGKVSAP
jgi:hypothetical protein